MADRALENKYYAMEDMIHAVKPSDCGNKMFVKVYDKDSKREYITEGISIDATRLGGISNTIKVYCPETHYEYSVRIDAREHRKSMDFKSEYIKFVSELMEEDVTEEKDKYKYRERVSDFIKQNTDKYGLNLCIYKRELVDIPENPKGRYTVTAIGISVINKVDTFYKIKDNDTGEEKWEIDAQKWWKYNLEKIDANSNEFTNISIKRRQLILPDDIAVENITTIFRELDNIKDDLFNLLKKAMHYGGVKFTCDGELYVMEGKDDEIERNFKKLEKLKTNVYKTDVIEELYDKVEKLDVYYYRFGAYCEGEYVFSYKKEYIEKYMQYWKGDLLCLEWDEESIEDCSITNIDDDLYKEY